MEVMRGVRYRLTSEILCAGSECGSHELFYLSGDSVVEVVNSDCVPFIEVVHSKGKARLFAVDLLARSVVVTESSYKSAAA